MPKLNNKQLRFVDEYMVTLNATQAAIEAGYSPKTAYSQGQRLLKHVEISDLIAQKMDERAERTRVTADRVVTELAAVGFANIRDLATWGELGVRWRESGELRGEDAAAVKDVHFTHEVRYDKNGERIETTNTKLILHDKKGALKMLGDHVGIFGTGSDETHKATENFRMGADAMRQLWEEKQKTNEVVGAEGE